MLALTRYSALLNIISHQLQHINPLSILTREGKRRWVLQRAMENASKASSSHSVTEVIVLKVTVPIQCFPTACMHSAYTCLTLAVNTVYTAVDN